MQQNANTGSFDSPYRFNAKEQDPETGNYYYGARYYNPQTSIWFGVDPLAAKYPHVTPYNFVEGNPIMLIDPTGMGPEDPGDNKKVANNPNQNAENGNEVARNMGDTPAQTPPRKPAQTPSALIPLNVNIPSGTAVKVSVRSLLDAGYGPANLGVGNATVEIDKKAITGSWAFKYSTKYSLSAGAGLFDPRDPTKMKPSVGIFTRHDYYATTSKSLSDSKIELILSQLQFEYFYAGSIIYIVNGSAYDANGVEALSGTGKGGGWSMGVGMSVVRRGSNWVPERMNFLDSAARAAADSSMPGWRAYIDRQKK